MKTCQFFFALLLLLASGRANAQANASDPKAISILNNSKAKFNALADVSASFKYTLQNKGTNAEKKGTIKIKGKKYRVNFGSQEMICDANTVWVILKEEKEVNISDFDPNESLSLDRIYRIYEKETKVRLEKDELVNGINYTKISLFSNLKETDYFKVEVWINKTNNFVERAKIFARNGSTILYELTNIKTNSGVSDSEFSFNKASYPGYETIDLR